MYISISGWEEVIKGLFYQMLLVVNPCKIPLEPWKVKEHSNFKRNLFQDILVLKEKDICTSMLFLKKYSNCKPFKLRAIILWLKGTEIFPRY